MGAQFSFGGSPDYYDDNEQLVSSRHSRRSSPTNTGSTMAAAPSKDVYAAMQSPEPHSAIHIDFSNGGSTPKLEGSGYDKVMYDHDLVMIFPYREGGELKKPEKFTADAFVTLMMGKHQERSTDGKMVIDTFQRVLRTTRCYLDDQGRELLTVSDTDHSAKAEQRRWHAEEEILKAEYEKATGSRQMTTEAKFCELVATAVARRVQLACGLTTRMFRSCDGDEIIMTLKADDNDLRVEADRTDYPLQVSNKPFDLLVHGEKLENVRREIGDNEMQNSMDHLKKIRGCPDANPDTPEMDPLLMSEQGAEYHPDLHVATKLWGHTEEADGLFVEDHSCRPMKAKGIWGRFYHGLMEVSYDPRTYFAPFADYRIEPMYQPYYRRYPVKWGDKKEETLFLQKDRIRLAASIVHRHINTDALVVAEYLAGKMFALHDEVALNDLRHSWALRWRMMNQPLQKIRYYFGEKVALYFAWLGFYTKMLIFPTIAGIITFIVVETRRKKPDQKSDEGANQGFILIVFAVLVVVWSSVFAEIWKRKNHLYNALWGMHGYHRGLQYRAQFRGTKSYNPVTDAEEMTFEDRNKRKRAFYVSILVVLTMIGIVLVALFGLFVLKWYINDCEKDDITCNVEKSYHRPLTLATTAANAIQILLLNMVYRGVAKKLNALENHRTDREYENHLIIKVFLFQFCNSFASFFYIAFLKRTVEKKCLPSKFGEDDCMTELRDQLLILFLIRIIVGNTLEVVIPYLKYRYQLYKERGSMTNAENGSSKKQRHNYIEEQAKLVPYEQEEAFEDYNEMVIQFGFINLFVVAFPLTPLLALCNNMMEVHVDAVKLCFVHRRPFPHAAKSIGAWFYILRFMSYIALATNSALILWTSGLFKTEETDSIDKSGITDMTKAFIFVVSCQVCIMLSMLIERVVSDVPKQLQLLEMRHDHIVNIVFRNLWSGDDSQLGETSETLDLTIFPNDQWEDRQPLLVAKAVDGGDSSGTN